MKPGVLFDIDGTIVVGYDDQTVLPNRMHRLQQLADAGVCMAAVTNRSCYAEDDTPESVQLLNEEFINITGNLIRHVYWFERPSELQKPSGFMLRVAIEAEGMDPSNTIYVGNEDTDEAAAADAEIPFVHTDDFFGTCGDDALAAFKEAELLKAGEWTSPANLQVHADKHGHEFGGPDQYVSFEQALSSNPDALAGFVYANRRCDARGCTTGLWHPDRKIMFVRTDDGKTVTMFRRDKAPKELRHAPV